MNPEYEFISYQQEQLIALTQRMDDLRSSKKQDQAAWVKFIDKCGDLLIDGGSWMKRVSSSRLDNTSVGLFPQN